MVGFEFEQEATGIDVEGFEDGDNRVTRDMVLNRPTEDVQILLSRFELFEDVIQQFFLIRKVPRQQPKISAI
jgi:hypothetical protein